MKNILKLTIIYAVIGTFLAVVVLALADNFIYSINNSSIITNSSTKITQETFKVDTEATQLQYSYNNKYYTYLKDGNIQIYSTEKKELIDTIDDENNICFYNLLYDKNLMIYFTEKVVGTTSKLTIKTYEISSKSKMDYNSINVNNFIKIKELEGSPVINVKYINVESKYGSKVINTVHRIDLFNNITTEISGKLISKLVMLKQKDRLYYEDMNDNVYYNGSIMSIFKEDVNVMGTDLDDNIYFISAEKKNKVYKVQANKIVKTIELSDTDVVSFYSDNTNVYLIYPTYVINISSETEPFKRLIKLSEYVKFDSIKTNTAYLKMSDGTIIKRDLIKSN